MLFKLLRLEEDKLDEFWNWATDDGKASLEDHGWGRSESDGKGKKKTKKKVAAEEIERFECQLEILWTRSCVATELRTCPQHSVSHTGAVVRWL